MITIIKNSRKKKRVLKQKLVLLLLSTIISTITFTGCGGGSGGGSSSTSGTVVTGVDGYIKNATVKDALGQTATYSSSGKYTFASSPTYPLSLTGGQLEDTNASFDINMTAQSGSSVLSPIATFLENNSTLLSKFANLGLGISTIDEFTVDYINSNDLNLSKLSQLLYVMIKDDTLLTTFKTNINANEGSLDNLFLRAHTDSNASASNGKFKIRIFLNKVNSYTGTASGMEDFVKNYKNSIISSLVDGNRTILKTGQITEGYDNDGTSGTGTQDDGTLSRGITRSYTDNANGTVTDNATTLIWQKEDDNNTYNWTDAIAYCDNLNLGGSTAWRLPTIEEFVQLADKGTSSPAINAVFTNTNISYYRSSTISASNNNDVWNIHFVDSRVGMTINSFAVYARCVRSAD
ncbi:MAG: DUF1566 domain-containing protein [Arcobacteraceae bacterium]|nr:DUF1566 domain-containing protein [Arcobacteraceae bacterium]